MGTAEDFVKEKLVIGVLISVPEKKEKLINALTEKFGQADYVSPPMDFTFTDYYNEEMGDKIERFFISFADLVDPSSLAEIKLVTNSIEDSFAENGKRKINLDPGILSVESFILATTKNNGHRIPLKKGIYAEVTLMFVNRQFVPLQWTYADYRSEDYRRILTEIRKKYKEDLKRQE